MKILVGLGNPGQKYLLTRHNLGFMLIDSLAQNDSFQNKHKSLIQKSEIEEEKVLLVKPQTFMNLSGQAVRDIMHFYKIPLENLLVIQDDKDQAFGKMKFQKSRGDGGHKGIENIHQELKSQDYNRLKMGVASSLKESSSSEKQEETLSAPIKIPQDTAQFVLSPFNFEEKQKLSLFLELGRKAVHCFVKQGFETASNQFNGQSLEAK